MELVQFSTLVLNVARLIPRVAVSRRLEDGRDSEKTELLIHNHEHVLEVKTGAN